MHTPLKISLIYAGVAMFWILFSDQALHFAANGGDDFVTAWQSIKGTLFVVVTTGVLYAVLRYYFRKNEQARQEKREIFDSTVDAAAHILNNFLNDMVYFRMVAEDSPFIEREVLDEYDQVIRKTSSQLRRLSELENVSARDIRNWLENREGHLYQPAADDEQ